MRSITGKFYVLLEIANLQYGLVDSSIYKCRYKYKFLRATTSNIPGSVIKDNRGSKLTIGRGGMLKVQHLVSVARPSTQHAYVDSAAYQQPSRIAYIEFFVKPEVDEEPVNDS